MTAQEYIVKRCTEQQLTTEAICALLANIQAESAFNPCNLEDTANDKLEMTDAQYTQAVDNGSYANFVRDGFGYGLAQWTFYTRKQMLINFAMARRKSIGDLEMQVDFMFWEFKGSFASIWQMMHESHDLHALTKILLNDWENPKEKIENLKVRYGYAKQWLSKINITEVTSRMTQDEAVEKLLAAAKAEIGYHEKRSNSQLDDKAANSGSGNWTKYARDLASTQTLNGDKNGYAWCAVFCIWLFTKVFGEDLAREMLCLPKNSAGAGCLYEVQYYKQANRWATYPQPGDQIFFSYSAGEVSHTGIVEAVSNGMVHTIEGNTSDQVARRSYPLASGSIVGYGRPRWELATGAAASAPVSTPVQTQHSTSSLYSGTVLRRGSRGAEVKEYQEKLIKLGFDLGTYGADGDFGDATFRAVQNFQTKFRLVPVDGEIGKDTKFAINEAVKALNSSSPKAAPNVVVNSDSQQVVYGTPVSNAEKAFCAIGDIVNFTGSSYFKRADGGGRTACKPGKALVIGLSKNGKYPYQLCKINGYGSTVYGWVVFDQVAKVD